MTRNLVISIAVAAALGVALVAQLGNRGSAAPAGDEDLTGMVDFSVHHSSAG